MLVYLQFVPLISSTSCQLGTLHPCMVSSACKSSDCACLLNPAGAVITHGLHWKKVYGCMLHTDQSCHQPGTYAAAGQSGSLDMYWAECYVWQLVLLSLYHSSLCKRTYMQPTMHTWLHLASH